MQVAVRGEGQTLHPGFQEGRANRRKKKNPKQTEREAESRNGMREVEGKREGEEKREGRGLINSLFSHT